MIKFIFTICTILAIAAATSWTCDGSCIAGYHLSTNSKKCEVCPPGCSSCINNSKCLTCLDGYFMNPKTNICDPCLPGCQVCDNTKYCHLCSRPTHYSIGCGSCIKCSEKCLNCTSSRTCYMCSDGYQLTGLEGRITDSLTCCFYQERIGNYCYRRERTCERIPIAHCRRLQRGTTARNVFLAMY